MQTDAPVVRHRTRTIISCFVSITYVVSARRLIAIIHEKASTFMHVLIITEF